LFDGRDVVGQRQRRAALEKGRLVHLRTARSSPGAMAMTLAGTPLGGLVGLTKIWLA